MSDELWLSYIILIKWKYYNYYFINSIYYYNLLSQSYNYIYTLKKFKNKNKKKLEKKKKLRKTEN